MQTLAASVLVLIVADLAALAWLDTGRPVAPASPPLTTTAGPAVPPTAALPPSAAPRAPPDDGPRTSTTTVPASSLPRRLDLVPQTAPPPATPYPDRRATGYRGAEADLRVIDSDATAPAGTSWNEELGFLQVDADDLALDRAYVKGGVDFHGRGTLAIRNSVVEGGYGTWFVVLGRAAGSTVDVRHSTLRWRPGATPDAHTGVGAIQVQANLTVVAVGNDISGTPDGIQLAGAGSRIERNWIHDLAVVGQYPNNTHNDGIQLYDGDDVVIAGNRIEIGFNGSHQNAAIFVQPGDGNSVRGLRVESNYLEGGGFTFRLEKPVTVATVVRDNVFAPLPVGAFGHVLSTDGAEIAEWAGNRQVDGAAVPPP